MIFLAAIFGVATLSGATASLVGFGIGSMLTPLLAVQFGMDRAVAAVALPHAVATAIRCWRLRASIDWAVLKRFGLLSAVGGLAGALIYTLLDAGILKRVLGGLLLLTAVAQFSGLANRWHPRGAIVALLGLGSGFFGGIAGNQGGLRACCWGCRGSASGWWWQEPSACWASGCLPGETCSRPSHPLILSV